ncbi:uncharacterized protein L969DRAFT_42277 [Mixia osmundae IAM 14324]|uniref:Glutamine amidotransferase domain-containing protein n=1 Tax=Mixia osmundae (strain CBS 9802 / IAM 14324 / JCM 22182 / KY 12970) TaxID=764103 RepID=G7DTJ5_MIXOS|nr:uncharacterized protein L969DRAFT_42277 [Mixia osmundae IAM 14324]KEI42821.1 hypothetical protein L969DRAFT_42277 [Mixia osmundae IAM 14324]GAA93842.1 hypothetical protein E5Q_00488 [Mixia osmundae IAM 14324]
MLERKLGPNSAATQLELIILLADTPVEPVRKRYPTYHDVFCHLFERAIDGQLVSLLVNSYDVVRGEYPDQARVGRSQGLLITGSAASAYSDISWIHDLTRYIASLPSSQPDLKLIGICFGHQIIAQAFGANVTKNDLGWELGVRTIDLTEAGRAVFYPSQTKQQTIDIHQVHKDHVPKPPTGFINLGSTAICPCHGMIKLRHPGARPDLANIHMFTVQGHPEFSPEIVTDIIDVREQAGVIDSALAAQSRQDAALHDDGVDIARICVKLLAAAQ